MEKALVTGASGFIGKKLTERLRADGIEVVGLDMQTDRGAGTFAGDITLAGGWEQYFEGCDTVFHTAAAVTNTATIDQGWRANVLGTHNVLEAALAAGATRFVHFSSIRAFGDSGFPDQVRETHPPRPDTSVYVNTKIASEQVVLAAHAAQRIQATVLRPGDVYGPGSRPWVMLIVEAIRSNQFLLPAMGKGIFSPVYIDNLIDGVLLAGTRPEGAGRIFTLTDGISPTTKEFFGNYYRMLGKRGPLCVPTPVALAIVSGPEYTSRLMGTKSEVIRESMRYLARDAGYSIQTAQEVLGYEPTVTLEEGMNMTESWLRENGLVA